MHNSIEVEITLLQTPTTVQTNMKFRVAYCVLKIQCVLLQYNIPSRLSSLLHKDATFYKLNAGEIWFQWASQPATLIPLKGVLGRKSRKPLLFGPSIALKNLIWRPNSQRKRRIYLQWSSHQRWSVKMICYARINFSGLFLPKELIRLKSHF